MKKTLLATGVLFAMGATSAHAGMLTAGASYNINVIAGSIGGVSCFDFGNCDTTGGSAKVTDYSLTVTGTNTQDIWTTGTMTANAAGANPAFSLTGVPITGSDATGYTGELIAAGNIGTAWLFFADTQYSERYDISIVTAGAPPIPVPAAVWLFGSGLLGLVGVARRRKA